MLMGRPPSILSCLKRKNKHTAGSVKPTSPKLDSKETRTTPNCIEASTLKSHHNELPARPVLKKQESNLDLPLTKIIDQNEEFYKQSLLQMIKLMKSNLDIPTAASAIKELKKLFTGTMKFLKEEKVKPESEVTDVLFSYLQKKFFTSTLFQSKPVFTIVRLSPTEKNFWRYICVSIEEYIPAFKISHEEMGNVNKCLRLFLKNLTNNHDPEEIEKIEKLRDHRLQLFSQKRMISSQITQQSKPKTDTPPQLNSKNDLTKLRNDLDQIEKELKIIEIRITESTTPTVPSVLKKINPETLSAAWLGPLISKMLGDILSFERHLLDKRDKKYFVENGTEYRLSSEENNFLNEFKLFIGYDPVFVRKLYLNMEEKNNPSPLQDVTRIDSETLKQKHSELFAYLFPSSIQDEERESAVCLNVGFYLLLDRHHLRDKYESHIDRLGIKSRFPSSH